MMNLLPTGGSCTKQWLREIDDMNIEALARSSGFQKRTQRKISMRAMLMGMLALATTGHQSLERVAASIARCAKAKYSKQALGKRLGAPVVGFMASVFVHCFRPALSEASSRGIFAPFNRLLLHDSTNIALRRRYAPYYPGSSNQRGAHSQMKVQLICDLLKSSVEQASVSGFTRNDQSAAGDILNILKPGDLVIRDLGYFVLSVFQKIIEASAFFVSRYRHDTKIADPSTHEPLNLLKLLKKQGSFDGWVLLGAKEKLRVRLVALPVSDAVANERRRTLRQNRDRRLAPKKEHILLLGWNIFVSNVPETVWPTQTFLVVYRLRWRIETLFKAFKHHLRLTELSDHSLGMIRLTLMTRLIYCAFVYRTCQHLEIIGSRKDRHASILRVANIFCGFALCFEAAITGMTLQQLLVQLIEQHAYYEQRSDRKNFQEILAACLTS
jgi:hypothetical protein